jgi:hypothetical protein
LKSSTWQLLPPKIEALLKATHFMNNTEPRPTLFFETLKDQDVCYSKSKLRGGAAFPRHTCLVRRDCTTDNEKSALVQLTCRVVRDTLN